VSESEGAGTVRPEDTGRSEHATQSEALPIGLWPGDTGGLLERSRRALVVLVRGPYLARAQRRDLWEGLVADERAIRARLHDLFLDLVIDTEHEFAFIRPVELDGAPEVVRTRALTFMDTVMLLAIRQRLLADEHRGRVYVSREELADELLVYRTSGRDETDYRRRVGASWTNLTNLGLLHTSEEGRAEISPVVRFIIGPEQVAAIRDVYERIAHGELRDAAGGADPSDSDEDGGSTP
jgi:hypothetical protein